MSVVSQLWFRSNGKSDMRGQGWEGLPVISFLSGDTKDRWEGLFPLKLGKIPLAQLQVEELQGVPRGPSPRHLQCPNWHQPWTQRRPAHQVQASWWSLCRLLCWPLRLRAFFLLIVLILTSINSCISFGLRVGFGLIASSPIVLLWSHLKWGWEDMDWHLFLVLFCQIWVVLRGTFEDDFVLLRAYLNGGVRWKGRESNFSFVPSNYQLIKFLFMKLFIDTCLSLHRQLTGNFHVLAPIESKMDKQ